MHVCCTLDIVSGDSLRSYRGNPISGETEFCILASTVNLWWPVELQRSA